MQEEKSSGPRTCTSDENVLRIQQAFERSPRIHKSTCCANQPWTCYTSYNDMLVWHAFRQRLSLKTYRLQLVQALCADDKMKRVEFCNDFLDLMETMVLCPGWFLVAKLRFVSSAKSTVIRGCAHLGTPKSSWNRRTWTRFPQNERFCAISQTKIYGPHC